VKFEVVSGSAAPIEKRRDDDQGGGILLLRDCREILDDRWLTPNALGRVDIRGFPLTRECDSRSQLRRAILIRRELTSAQWRRIEQLVPGKEGDKGRHGEDNRLFVDAVLWIARSGAPWRDLPGEFGNWNSVFQRFRRWAKKGVWQRVFRALIEHPDFEYLIIDSTIVRAHQHAAGAKGGAKMRRSGVRAAA